MKQLTRRTLKALLFAFIVISLQTALFSRLSLLPVNLPLATILVFTSLLGLFESVIVALAFCVFIAFYSYNSEVYWIYPLIAVICSKINPPQIADKFLICIVYSFLFTPLIELVVNHGVSFDKILSAILINSLSVIIIFFIVKFIYRDYKIISL